jgi:hypothetical protein
MQHDQYGRPLAVGDAVTVKGSLVSITDEPNYINCEVKLDQPMPPSGAEVKIQINTKQVVKDVPASPEPSAHAHKEPASSPPPAASSGSTKSK